MVSTIPREYEQFVAQQLAGGEYGSAEEVVAAGLGVLQEVKRRQVEFRQDVQVGIDQLDRGQGIKVKVDELKALFDKIEARGRARYEASKRGK